MSDAPLRVSFVCLGNICRSPTAEGIFLHMLKERGLSDEFIVDSAGTSGYHVGERPHPDTIRAARDRGVELVSRSRQFTAADFGRFDLVLALDGSNRRALQSLAPDEDARAKIHLLRDFDPDSAPGSDMPDPYYEGGFPNVFRLCEQACAGLLNHLQTRHQQGSGWH